MRRMRQTSRIVLFSAGTACVAVMLAAGVARAVCPDTLCECMPWAGQLTAVAVGGLTAKTAALRVGGVAQLFPATISGPTCATAGTLVGNGASPTELDDVMLRAASGRALKIRTTPPAGPGVLIHGSVLTEGGVVDGQSFATIDGTVDTNQAVFIVAHCGSAVNDAMLAADAFPRLVVTQTLGDVTAKGTTVVVDATAPGTSVFSAGAILVNPLVVSGSPVAGTVHIMTAPETSAVIINATKLKVGKASRITADDPDKVIINVVGPGAQVAISRGASVDVAILAKDRKIAASQGAQTANVYGQALTLKGATVDDALGCGPFFP